MRGVSADPPPPPAGGFRYPWSYPRSLPRNPEAHPFWIVSIYLSLPESDLDEALVWVRTVRNLALRERLLTYVHMRLARWDDAVRGISADPPRQAGGVFVPVFFSAVSPAKPGSAPCGPWWWHPARSTRFGRI